MQREGRKAKSMLRLADTNDQETLRVKNNVGLPFKTAETRASAKVE